MTRPASDAGPRRAALALLLALAAWQAVAAVVVEIEYYDGYETIINARYLVGDSPSYIPVRFPAMAVLTAPAEALRAPAPRCALPIRRAIGTRTP